jgi:hypothetical protein
MRRQIHLTRQQLHALVNARASAAVAQEIGVSERALKKACERSGIPLPGRDYWAALGTASPLPLPKLPPPELGQPRNILFSVEENPRPRPPKPQPAAVTESVASPVPPSAPVSKPVVVVPSRLTKPHPLVEAVEEAAKGRKEDKGVLPFRYDELLRVRTSVRSLRRSLLLLDTLIKAFERKGFQVRVGGGWRKNETELVLKQGAIEFRLDERTKQTPPPRPRSPYGSPRYVLVATGEFTLSFDSYLVRGLPHQWRDKPGRPLELQLDEVMAAIPLWEAALLADRLRKEEEAARAKAAEERRVAEAKRRETVRRQRVQLVSNLLKWEQASRLRAFVAAVEAIGDESPATQQWLAWAREQVAMLDANQANLARLTNLEVDLSGYVPPQPYAEKPALDWWS